MDRFNRRLNLSDFSRPLALTYARINTADSSNVDFTLRTTSNDKIRFLGTKMAS